MEPFPQTPDPGPLNSERSLQEQTRQLLELLFNTGQILEFYHVFGQGARRSRPGFPDWFIIARGWLPNRNGKRWHRKSFFWIELKRPGEQLTKDQARWGKAIGHARFHIARSLDQFTWFLRYHGVDVG